MNMVFEFAINIFVLKREPHPHPFNVVWVDKTFLSVKK